MKAISKILVILPLFGFMNVACSSYATKVAKNADSQEGTSAEKTYENEFFSVDYPAEWVCEEEINNMCDTVPAMAKGINVVLYNPDPQMPWPVIRIQKSAMVDLFSTPEEGRDISVQLKQLDGAYLGTLEDCMADSLKVGSSPAAMAGFVSVTEQGDTVIQKQLVVMVGKEVYYLNNIFDYNDEGILEVMGDAILETVKFKHEK